MRHYSNISRNFKKMADISKNGQFLLRGASQVVNTLISFPQTEHDPISFKVDLMYYTVSIYM